MIREDVLRLAAAEADRALLAFLPPPEDCRHEFSPVFLQKMRRTFRRVRHPVLYHLPRYAACFLLTAAVAGGSWLTLDAEARTAFFSWVRRQQNSFVEYRFVGQPPADSQTQTYRLSYLPAGYAVTETLDLDGLSVVICQDDTGHLLHFSYSAGSDATSLFVMDDNAPRQEIVLGDVTADLYLAQDPEEASVLVWISEQDGMAFFLSAALPEEELVKVMEGIEGP